MTADRGFSSAQTPQNQYNAGQKQSIISSHQPLAWKCKFSPGFLKSQTQTIFEDFW